MLVLLFESTSHEQNVKTEFLKDVLAEMNDNELLSEAAFTRGVSKWLGYEIHDENIVDGAGDRGIDFWYTSDTGFDIFQIKTHKLIDGNILNSEPFDKEGVLDFQRIKTYLIDDQGIPEHNLKLKRFKERWNHTVAI